MKELFCRRRPDVGGGGGARRKTFGTTALGSAAAPARYVFSEQTTNSV